MFRKIALVITYFFGVVVASIVVDLFSDSNAHLHALAWVVGLVAVVAGGFVVDYLLHCNDPWWGEDPEEA